MVFFFSLIAVQTFSPCPLNQLLLHQLPLLPPPLTIIIKSNAEKHLRHTIKFPLSFNGLCSLSDLPNFFNILLHTCAFASFKVPKDVLRPSGRSNSHNNLSVSTPKAVRFTPCGASSRVHTYLSFVRPLSRNEPHPFLTITNTVDSMCEIHHKCHIN